MSEDTKLLERLSSVQKQRGAPICPVVRLLGELDERTATLLNDMLIGGQGSIAAIHRELRLDGFAIAKTSLSLHRNKMCVCARNE